ncbi:MAG: precorrin-2 C(20)-methyltransferase [Rhizobiaceae bacterium]
MAETGRLIGVGTGPGDPELLTLKAVRAIAEADLLAYFAKRGNDSNARRIVAPHVPPGIAEMPLLYPVTTELPANSDGYRDQIATFYRRSAEALEAELSAGRTVAVLSEGDPLFYGSYMHIHARLATRYPTEVIPGITAMSGCWSQAGTPISQGDDILTVLPATMAEERLAEKLADSDAAVIMKIGRNLAKVRRTLEHAGRLGRAIYVERATMDDSLSMPLAEKLDDKAPYFSIVLVPGWEAAP